MQIGMSQADVRRSVFTNNSLTINCNILINDSTRYFGVNINNWIFNNYSYQHGIKIKCMQKKFTDIV